MKINVSKGLIGMASAAILLSAMSAHAERWDFNNGSSPLDGGWKYDLDVRQKKNNTRFPVRFVGAAHTKIQNNKLVVTSGDYPAGISNTEVQGGGIQLLKGFKNRSFTAQCNMKGSDAELKRSQAAYWLDKGPGKESHEIDMFELRPSGKNVLNYIGWANGKINESQSASVKQWGNASDLNGKYVLTLQNNVFKVTKDGKLNTHPGSHGNPSATYKAISGKSISDNIIIHNKPWRFNDKPQTAGKVATLECDYAERPDRMI